MKKHLLKVMLLILATVSFTACNDDDGDNLPVYVFHSTGAYIVNSGNQSSAIEGSLSYFDYASKAATQKIFSGANGRSLGLTANDGLAYGNKIYIVVDGENTIEVIDKKTRKSVAQISTTGLMGADKGKDPRHITCGAGEIFFTTYGASGNGYVAAVDTATFSLKKTWEVGSYPEGITGYGNVIFVANSDYGKGKGTISAIDLTNDKVTNYTITGVENPQKVFINSAGVMYILDWGHYLTKAPYTQENAGLKQVYGTSVSKTINATLADFYADKFYLVNAPYGSGTIEYSIFDTTTGSMTPFPASVDAPTSISVDPVYGYIFITSNKKDGTGYADYNGNGYVKQYNADGSSLLNTFDTGVGPVHVFFDATVTIQDNNK